MALYLSSLLTHTPSAKKVNKALHISSGTAVNRLNEPRDRAYC